MESDSSITRWISGLKAGEAAAVEAIWKRYADSLVGLATRRLESSSVRFVDGEDVAQSVFHQVCRGAAAGRFADLSKRDELWWLLLRMTKQRVIDHVRREKAIKRGGGAVENETALAYSGKDGEAFSLELIAANDPTPEFVVALEEQAHRLLGLLRDDRLREIALAKIEGLTNAEIAAKLTITVRSVERKLQLIRKRWAMELQQEGG